MLKKCFYFFTISTLASALTFADDVKKIEETPEIVNEQQLVLEKNVKAEEETEEAKKIEKELAQDGGCPTGKCPVITGTDENEEDTTKVEQHKVA